ncbi:MAG: DMT family transporter [Rickettsiaceae bacterium]|nr:DMT family transporter [Rickettsiaceae bacterium]
MRINNYFLGAGWFVLSLISSVMNDIISKYIGYEIHPLEVAFFRFLFSALTLLPFILYYGPKTIKSSAPTVHFFRGLILFFGISAWTYGLSVAPLATATLISFTIPLFTLILAFFFLNEKIIWQRWVATIIGFIGIGIASGAVNSEFQLSSMIFVISAIGFALLDIINKQFVIKETMTSMLFYSALVTALLAFIPAAYFWKNPSMTQIFLFFILGGSANLILFFILKAFSLIDATAIAPYRYLELFMSSFLGYFLFSEIPTMNLFYGALIIIPSTLFIVYSENTKKS